MFREGFQPIVVGLACLWCQDGQPRDRPDPTPVVVARIEHIRETPSALYCECNQIRGRNLVFDLALENRSDRSLTVYAFVWAANDRVDPAERGLWPVAAVDSCLTKTGELKIQDPRRGARCALRPRGAATLKGSSLLQPIGWFEGRLVSFETLRVEVWSADAGRLFCHELRLQEEQPAAAASR
jgi:hypothetical protein